jgi:hypothetical protein
MKLVLQRLVRKLESKDEPWRQLSTIGYPTLDPETGTLGSAREINMQKLVVEEPDVLLSGLTGGRPVVVIEEFPLHPSVGLDIDLADRYLDLLALDSDGGVYAIECKLAKNPDAEGAVLDQVRRYGVLLSRLRYADLNRTNQKKQRYRVGSQARILGSPRDPKGWEKFPSLAEDMGRAVSEAAPGTDAIPLRWSSSEWEQAVNANLSQKLIRLVVAVDHVHAKLDECLGAGNASLGPNSYEAVSALELLRIIHGDSEFLIPRVTVPRSAPTRPRTFEEGLRLAGAAGRAVHSRVLAWATNEGLEMRQTPVSFHVVDRNGQRVVTLYLNPRIGKLELNLDAVRSANGAAGGIRMKVAELFGGVVAETYPNIGFDAVNTHWDVFATEVLAEMIHVADGRGEELA